MKQYLKIFIIILTISTLAATAYYGVKNINPAESKPIECTKPEETYQLTSSVNGFRHFINDIDGYFLDIPADFDVHMKHADVFTLFSNENTRIEIYRQPAPDKETKDIYINYSNSFLENRLDHKHQAQSTEQFGDNYAYVTAWEREKNDELKKDYNHYISFDIITDANIFSFFIKSTDPINKADYADIIASFGIIQPEKNYRPAQTSSVNLDQRGWNRETRDFYERFFSEDSKLTWGIFDPDFCGFRFDRYKNLESRFEYDFPVMIWYNHIKQEPDETYWTKLLNESYQRGKVLELTLQTTDTENGETNMVYGVLRGEYDDYLKKYAKTISEFGHPVLFRLGNEMNGDWCTYSGFQTGKDTLIFREFYRYVYNLFEEAGANKNVIWIWNPNGKSMPPFQWNHPLMYYPGDEFVDIVGMTAYNTGTHYSDIGETWHSFFILYHEIYDNYRQWFGQPLMITEFASASEGGNKAVWISDMFRDIRLFPKIKMAIWWNHCDYEADGSIARSYIIDESEKTLEAFYNGLHGVNRIITY